MKNKERIVTWVLILLFAVVTLAWAAGQDMKGAFDYWGDVIFKSSGTVTMEGAVTTSGEATFSNGVFCNDEFVQEIYTHATSTATSGSDSLTWAFSYGNTLYISGASTFTLTLPQGTSTYDGYRLLVKNTGNAVARTITAHAAGAAGVTDYIETVVGTATGSSDATIDAIGDWRMWELDMDSTGVTGYWRLIADGVRDSFDRNRTFPVELTEVAGTGFTISSAAAGNVFLIPTAKADGACGAPGQGLTAGVTVVIPTPTSSNVGWEVTIVNTTGTSPFYLYIDGTQQIGTSGTTMFGSGWDAEGDNVTIGYYEIDQAGVSVYVVSDIVDGT